jgi:uncharacterized protein (DUF1810 family)
MILMDKIELARFLDAQNKLYLKALSEIRNGKKETHWMWFIFPQLKGLGFSETAKFYGIKDLDEATEYLAHPILGKHLIEITEALLAIEGKTATEILGQPDDIKLRSCMTLFANVKNTHPIFEQVLEKYFHGSHDEYTLELLVKHKLAAND